MVKYCKDCKYYHKLRNYCTSVFRGKEFSPLTPVCDLSFEEGEFNNRFWVYAEPLGYSTGYYYVLVDEEDELKDDGDFIGFSYEYEAELICDFLNKQEDIIRKLEQYLENMGGSF